jgi:hypothetical protein
MSNINIQAKYDMFTKYPDIDVYYEQIKSAIDPNEKQYFQVYVDLFRTLGRKPTIDEFTDKINELYLSKSLGSLNLNKGGRRRRFRKSKRRKSSKRLRRRRATRRK